MFCQNEILYGDYRGVNHFEKKCTRLNDLCDFSGIYEVFLGFLRFFEIYGFFYGDFWDFIEFFEKCRRFF